MRAMALGGLLLAFSGTAAATDIDCNVNSDYDLGITPRSVILTRGHGTPRAIVMRGGRLFVDDRWVELGAADRARIAAYERGARETMPLARQIGHDAADIAFATLGEIAAGLGDDPDATRARLDAARARIDARLARSVNATHFNGADLGEGIAGVVREVVPMLVGDIVGGALRAAFSGDAGRLQRMDRLDERIEARVEPRAKALERNAEALCLRMQALDRIDDSLDYRLPDGRRLDLIEVSVERRH